MRDRMARGVPGQSGCVASMWRGVATRALNLSRRAGKITHVGPLSRTFGWELTTIRVRWERNLARLGAYLS
jgi:hypothetical protein